MTRTEIRTVPVRTISLNDNRVPNGIDAYRLVDVATCAELADHILAVWCVPIRMAAQIAQVVWAGGQFSMHSDHEKAGQFFSLDCEEAGFSKRARQGGFTLPALRNPNTMAVDGLTDAEREARYKAEAAAHDKAMAAHKTRMAARR